MVTRRDVIGGLAGILSARKMPAMLIGARTVCMTAAAGGGWKNPYVTEGLVAMFDGVWNAGGGVHDENATTWLDLAGGLVVAFSGTVHDNYIAFTNKTNVGRYLNKYFGNNKSFTVESVYDRSASTTFEYCGPFYVGYQIVNLYKGVSKKVTVGNHNQYRSTSSAVIGCSSSSFAVSGSDGNVRGHFNGTRIMDATASSQSLAASPQGESNTYIGGSLYTGGVDVYHIRIYSRALSNDEILANYAVDNARFNLQ